MEALAIKHLNDHPFPTTKEAINRAWAEVRGDQFTYGSLQGEWVTHPNRPGKITGENGGTVSWQ